MLAEMPVAAVSLNELSRRVGLAKSNVLRYYESREAVLLELLHGEARAWVDELGGRLALSDDTATSRAGQLAADIAQTLLARPVLCDLLSAEVPVLERNVSAEVLLRHRHAMADIAGGLATIIRKRLPELTAGDAEDATRVALLVAASAWPHERPSDELRAAFEADDVIAGARRSFAEIVTRTLTLTLHGLLVGKTPGVRIAV